MGSGNLWPANLAAEGGGAPEAQAAAEPTVRSETENAPPAAHTTSLMALERMVKLSFVMDSGNEIMRHTRLFRPGDTPRRSTAAKPAAAARLVLLRVSFTQVDFKQMESVWPRRVR